MDMMAVQGLSRCLKTFLYLQQSDVIEFEMSQLGIVFEFEETHFKVIHEAQPPYTGMFCFHPIATPNLTLHIKPSDYIFEATITQRKS